jgi:hypothetical protein
VSLAFINFIYFSATSRLPRVLRVPERSYLAFRSTEGKGKEARAGELAELASPDDIYVRIKEHNVSVEELRDELYDLHTGMPKDLKDKPMRLLKIAAVLEWPGLAVSVHTVHRAPGTSNHMNNCHSK